MLSLPTGNNKANGQQIVDKSGQWFGAHVATSPGVNNSGVVVVSGVTNSGVVVVSAGLLTQEW